MSATATSAFAQMTAREFEALSVEDKRTVLVGTLQKRAEAVRNVQAFCVTRSHNVAYRDGVVGSPLADRDFGRHECELRRDGGRYWATVKWFLPDATDRPTLQVETARDPESGTIRSVARHGQLTGVYGAINTREEEMLQCVRFLYWLDGTFDDEDEFPLKFIVKHQDAIVFDGLTDDGSEVRLSLAVKNARGTKTDTRAMRIAPQKGFMPTWIHRRRERQPAPHVEPSYFETDMTVEEMREIDDVWFPVRIKTIAICKQSVRAGEAGVYETEASDIDLGKVTAADMEVVFPDDMKVHDLTTGKWTVGGTEIAVGSGRLPKASEEHRSEGMGVVSLIGIVVACAGVVLFAMSRLRNRSGQLGMSKSTASN